MTRTLIGSVFAIALLATNPAFAAAQAAPLHIDSGAIEGVHENELVVYRGIPYAAPPVGDRRWREPILPTRWTGVRKADAFAPACVQQGVSMPGEHPPVSDEDCLYLNVWAPKPKAGVRVPVIAWFHGGGYTNGTAAMPLYWGDRLARKGAIVVTIGYRLGPLGFLAHPELTQESTRRSSGNYGLMDQIAALEWIQRNIGAFGGDPARVTIAGQSAGSMMVSMLMASPRAKSLFQRAIGQSGGMFEPVQLAPNYLLANAERDGEKYASSLGASSLRDLRNLPTSKFVGGRAASVSHPVIEPYVLPMTPYEAFSSGRHNDVPLLIGYNAEEARSLTNVATVQAASFEADIKEAFGELPSALIAAYSYSSDEEARQARLDFERDLRFGWDMWAWARLQARNGRNKAFFYYFNHRPPFPAQSVYEGWGASHFAELWYVFDHQEQEPWRWSAADKKLASNISSYWVNFANAGDPNGRGLPEWPPFSATSENVLYLASPISIGAVPNAEQLKGFDTIYSSLRNTPIRSR